MKKSIIKGIRKSVLVLLTGIVCACSESPNDGNLDGYWQLMTVQESAQSPAVDVQSERLYVGFRRGLAEYYSDYLSGSVVVYANYRHTSDSLFVYNFANGQDDTNPFYTTTDSLKRFYVDNLYERYAIEQLNDDRLWLSSGEKRLLFRKF
jgi:hypothetical protein